MFPQLQAAIDLFNRGDYLESQASLEALLPTISGHDESLAKGLLMLASAMHLFFHRGGGRGALNLMRQTLLTLDDLRPEHGGVAIDELCDAVQAYLDDLESRKLQQPRFIDRWLVPRIRVRR
jgi:predicted metal-dependent hydrolase